MNVESKFKEVIDQIGVYDLPLEIANVSDNGKSKPLTFGYGHHKQLIRFLEARQKNKVITYPLLWLIMPYSTVEERTFVKGDFKMILAFNTDVNWYNDKRNETTYKYYLYPYAELIKQALIGANNIDLIPQTQGRTDYFNLTKEPLFGMPDTFEGKEENKVFHYWDAITFEFEARITSNCLLNINFNKENLIQ